MKKVDGSTKALWVTAREFQRPSCNGKLTIKAPASRSLSLESERRLIEATYLAIDMTSNARKALKEYGANSPQRVRDLLQLFFSADFHQYDLLFRQLLGRIAQIDDGLREELTLKVTFPPADSVVQGYVAMRTLVNQEEPSPEKETDILHHFRGEWRVTGNIHLAQKMLSGSYEIHEVAAAIVHEASHRYAATVDLQYLQTHDTVLRYRYMKPDEAVENADSIARFCQYLAIPNLEVRQPLEVEGKRVGLRFMNGRTRC